MVKASLVIAALGLAVLASADSLRAQIVEMNVKLDTIMKSRNIRAFVNAEKDNVTRDFKYTEGDHSMTFDQMVATMKMSYASIKNVSKAQTKLVSLKETGSTAISTTQHNVVVSILDPQKKPHTMALTGISQESYRKERGKWKLAAMTWKSQSTTMDGKKMGG